MPTRTAEEPLFRGLGLRSGEVFYSSERDTGVPTGADLMSYVRKEVSGTTLVIAMITPMYQSRPVCVAEFGAAWGRADSSSVFPLLAPGMERSELQGVLRTLATLSAADEAALDELSDRVKQNWNRQVSNAQWGVGKRKWLTFARIMPALERPSTPTAEEHQRLLTERDELSAALDEVSAEVDEWKGKYEELAKTKDQKVARSIRVGKAVKARFTDAVDAAEAALRELPAPVHEAIYQSLRRSGAAYPDLFEDPSGQRSFDNAIERKLIVEAGGGDGGGFEPNTDKPSVRRAVEAVDRLRHILESGEEPDLIEWFQDQYPSLTPDLTDRDCWEELLG